MIRLVYILGLCVGIIANDTYAGEKENKQVIQQKKEASMSQEEWNVLTSAVQKEVARVTTPNVNLQPSEPNKPKLPSSNQLYHD